MGKELVWFRVASYTGDEMAHMDALAEKQAVPGKGYFARPICDLTRYPTAGLSNILDIIRTLTDEVRRYRGLEQ
jgi:hypothetical protein